MLGGKAGGKRGKFQTSLLTIEIENLKEVK